MITDAFDPRTIAKMEVALERACLVLPTGREQHNARRIIAGKIIECATRGNTSLIELTEAGYAASLQLTASAQAASQANASHRAETASIESITNFFEPRRHDVDSAAETRRLDTCCYPEVCVGRGD